MTDMQTNTISISANATARFNMIEQQVRPWDVLDPAVLQLFNEVPREAFVPKEYANLAFADIEIPLGQGQHMLSPKLEGRMLQSLGLKKTDRVLHIGTGSGYFAALLSKLSAHVTSVEIHADLSHQAAQNLTSQNIHHVSLLVADGVNGLRPQAPFDVIVYTGSCPVEPAGVRQQLSVGGRMLIVLGEAPVMQATLIQRVTQDAYRQDVLFETCLQELCNAPQAQKFEF
ncbi:MAG TPA: protein-L-isoaspartate O-methyltransferase [Methylophilus sp.]|nr:protein-L-isoaspartate O-methyltransferase [Methylophilus sp.]HQQ32998.1 protein-L-isoaspartate O-methyltransferase [Methylophilus sp.]